MAPAAKISTLKIAIVSIVLYGILGSVSAQDVNVNDLASDPPEVTTEVDAAKPKTFYQLISDHVTTQHSSLSPTKQQNLKTFTSELQDEISQETGRLLGYEEGQFPENLVEAFAEKLKKEELEQTVLDEIVAFSIDSRTRYIDYVVETFNLTAADLGVSAEKFCLETKVCPDVGDAGSQRGPGAEAPLGDASDVDETAPNEVIESGGADVAQGILQIFGTTSTTTTTTTTTTPTTTASTWTVVTEMSNEAEVLNELTTTAEIFQELNHHLGDPEVEKATTTEADTDREGQAGGNAAASQDEDASAEGSTASKTSIVSISAMITWALLVGLL
jgi:hypothetical protein